MAMMSFVKTPVLGEPLDFHDELVLEGRPDEAAELNAFERDGDDAHADVYLDEHDRHAYEALIARANPA